MVQKGRMIVSLLFAFGLLLVLGCKKENEIIPPISPTTSDTLYVTSFELNNLPDLSGWQFEYNYTGSGPWDTIVPTVCATGGQYALRVVADRLATSKAERYLTNLSGAKNLTLTFMATLNSGQNSASAYLRHIRNGTNLSLRFNGLAVWNGCQQFTMHDTLNFLPTDSLLIGFQGMGNTYETSNFLVDQILLKED